MNNITVQDKTTFSEVIIKEIARDSAEYLLSIFEADEDFDIFGIVCMLAHSCMNHSETVIYIKIKNYCKKSGNNLPEHYEEIAADYEGFNFYCRQLIYYMIELSR